MLGIIGDADSVELKLTIPDRTAIGHPPPFESIHWTRVVRQVYFFDTPDLALNRAGVVVRARRTQGAPDDTVVKLRPVVPAISRSSCAAPAS